MAPPTTPKLAYNEADILLTILAIDQNQIQSKKRAILAFNVPQSTL